MTDVWTSYVAQNLDTPTRTIDGEALVITPHDSMLHSLNATATYVWEHASYNAVDRRLVAHIHFELRDGRRLRSAFTYDWRMYTVPELRDAVHEAGFRDFEVWSEGWDAKAKRGNGTLYRRSDLDNEDTWIAYAVATR